jgi:hypothetical protein
MGYFTVNLFEDSQQVMTENGIVFFFKLLFEAGLLFVVLQVFKDQPTVVQQTHALFEVKLAAYQK